MTQKNVASQKIALFAFDTTTSVPKTGDAANITAYVSKDFAAVTVLGDTSATEMDATNAKGWYLFDLTQAETNADALLFTGKSGTADVSVVGQLIYTVPASFTSFTAPLDAAGTRSAVGLASANLDTQLSAIVGDTNELQTDWVNGGRLDNILDARASQASVDTIDGIVDSILVDTGTDIPASIDALPTNAELATALGTADDAVLAQVALVKAVTDKLDDTLEDDAGTYRFTVNALEEAPTGGSAPTANQNADALLDRADAIEVGLTPRQAMRLSASADGGKLSGGATTTNTIRNAVADSKDRIIATVDASGNRTAITYDLT